MLPENLIKVKFEYLNTLKDNGELVLSFKTFEENNEIYVDSITPVYQINSFTDGSTYEKYETKECKAPLYLALDSLRGYVQSLFPQAQISILFQSDLN